MPKIHATALVDPKAQLHDSVEVGPYCVIGPGVSVGAGTRLIAHVVLDGPLAMGSDNTVYPFACLGALSQDKSAKYTDDTRVEIEYMS